MPPHLVWFNDEQSAAPHLPANQPGPARKDDRLILSGIMDVLKAPSRPPEQAALDSTHVKAHRCAGGGKGGPANRRSASPEAAATANSTPLSTNYAGPG